MLFNSYIFILLFLPVTCIGYYGLNRLHMEKVAMGWLIAMSFVFYGYNNPWYLILLVGSIVVNHLVTHGMEYANRVTSSQKLGTSSVQMNNLTILKEEKKCKIIRKVLLFVALFFNIGMLFYFKYFDFFITNFNVIWKTEYTLLNIMLPLGISFYTFQQISYVVDCYMGRVKPYSFLYYASFVSFFPQLIAGPIVLHGELIPQFLDEKKKQIDYSNLTKGMYVFSLGLAKKVLLADTLGKVVHWGFANYMHIDATNTAVAMVCFTLQVYFDFSGYCDMAQGIGYLFNVELPTNFFSPYKSRSISEFWDRWHMTLTRFFTQYVYIPLGGNRKGKARTYCNIMIVFLISGFWHGADWNFVVWGILNGICIVLCRALGSYFKWVPKVICVAGTFLLTNLLWCFFKVQALRYAWEMIWNVFTGTWGNVEEGMCALINKTPEIRILARLGLESTIQNYPSLPLFVMIGCSLMGVFFMKNTQEKVENFRPTYWKLASFGVLLLWSVSSLADISEFLYFNF